MNHLVVFLALLWAVAADEIGDTSPLRARNLKKKGELCINFGDVKTTVYVDGEGNDGNFNWFRRQRGAKTYACEMGGEVESNRIGPGSFCRRIKRQYHELTAPIFAEDWLVDKGWKSGTCIEAVGHESEHSITMTPYMTDDLMGGDEPDTVDSTLPQTEFESEYNNMLSPRTRDVGDNIMGGDDPDAVAPVLKPKRGRNKGRNRNRKRYRKWKQRNKNRKRNRKQYRKQRNKNRKRNWNRYRKRRNKNRKRNRNRYRLWKQRNKNKNRNRNRRNRYRRWRRKHRNHPGQRVYNGRTKKQFKRAQKRNKRDKNVDDLPNQTDAAVVNHEYNGDYLPSQNKTATEVVQDQTDTEVVNRKYNGDDDTDFFE